MKTIITSLLLCTICTLLSCNTWNPNYYSEGTSKKIATIKANKKYTYLERAAPSENLEAARKNLDEVIEYKFKKQVLETTKPFLYCPASIPTTMEH